MIGNSLGKVTNALVQANNSNVISLNIPRNYIPACDDVVDEKAVGATDVGNGIRVSRRQQIWYGRYNRGAVVYESLSGNQKLIRTKDGEPSAHSTGSRAGISVGLSQTASS